MVNIEQLRADNLIGNLAPHLLNLKSYASLASHYSSILLRLSLISFLACIILIIRRIFLIKHSLNQKSILLELTPPAFTEKTAYTTQQLFTVIHSLAETKTFLDRLLGRKNIFSFEIASTLNQGIRYLIRIAPDEANNIKRNVLSYLPYVNVKTADEYLPENTEGLNIKVIEFKLKRHFAYPLQKQDILKEHDPVAYITGMMTKLEPKELVSFQIVISPTRTNGVNVIRQKILRDDDVLAYLDRIVIPANLGILLIPLKIVGVIFSILMSVLTTIINDHTGVRKQPWQYQTEYAQPKKKRILNRFEQEAVKAVEEKIDQQLFETKIRFLVLVKSKVDMVERIKGFTSSLAVFSVPGYQTLHKKQNLGLDKLLLLNFKKRLLSLMSNSSSYLLSVSEISDLYHFPFTRVTQTENIAKVHSKKLPAPISLKQEKKVDVKFAVNNYGGVTTDIGLTVEERARHMYAIGATGTGKSTMILSMASQDIKAGKGLAVIDPHGDLAEALLNFVPDKRKGDLIYFNPDDIKYPVGLNLLEMTPGLDADDEIREKELITESIISLFRKIFSEVWSAHAHRLEYTLRNTIQTALTLENPTLFTVYELLTNTDFQEATTSNLKDENLRNFWTYEFNIAGDYQKVKMIGPATSRIGRFLFSPSAKRILEQEKSTINFDKIMDGGKILICNLSKGKLGEDTSEVLGIMILTKIQLAALKRARITQKNRKPFYVYVDEFQNFATPSFIQMLSEARKYGVNMILAEQSTSQQKDRNLVNVVLANVGTTISFRSANPDDEKLMLPQFAPYIEKGEILNLPSYQFYAKIAALSPEESFSGATVPVDIKADKKKIEELIEVSRKANAIVYEKPTPTKASLMEIQNMGKNSNKNATNTTPIGSLS